MGVLFRIAFRNVRRHHRRTLLSAVTIAVGMTVFTFMDSMLAGMDRGGIDNMIELSTSAVQIQTPAYAQERDTFPLKYGLEQVEAVTRELEQDKRVRGTAPRTRFLGGLSNGTDNIPVVGTVIDPARDASVFSLTKHIEGRYLTPGGGNEILLGKRLAKELGVGVGDDVTLYALTRHDSQNADEFKVAGLLDTSDPNLNRSAAVITFEAAEDFLDLEGLVTEIDVSLQRRTNFADFAADMRDVQGTLKRAFPQLNIETFNELGAAFLSVSKQKRGFGMILMTVILLIAAVGIFNTVMMSVYERMREIGVLRAYGMEARDITAMFLQEGMLIGLVGGLMGTVGGSLVTLILITKGYPVDKIAGDIDTAGIPVWGTIYGEFNPGTMLFAFVFAVVVATVASVIPARKAGQLTVTRALRFV